MKIAIYSSHKFEEKFIKEANKESYELNFITKSLSLETVSLSQDSDVVLVFSSDTVDKKVLQSLKENKIGLIVSRSAGTDHIDLEEASALNILVTNVPNYSPNAIAEHCIAMVLGLYRKLKSSLAKSSVYNFELTGLVGREIHNKVFGICGTGEIGEVLARIAHGFGAKILLFDQQRNEALSDTQWAEYCSKEDLLKNADIISLNLPLNDGTTGFIGDRELSLMKDSAILINTGRGELVDTQIVLDALERNGLSGFGMDVYENEEGIFYNNLTNENKRDATLTKLLSMNNVLVTAHQAFLTETALENMMGTVFENILQFKEGKKLTNEVR